SPITGRLFDKYGGRILAATGLTILTVMTYLLSQLTMDTGYYYLMIVHAIRMLGMSMVMMPVQTNGLNQLPPRFYPHGTAMNNTLNMVSGAIGTAVLVTIMSIRTESHAAAMGPEAANGLAMMEGINDAFFVSTLLAAAALLLVLFMKRAKQAEDLPPAGKQA